MFKGKSGTKISPQAAAHTQKRMEVIQSQFESRVFSATSNGVTVHVLGTRKLQSITGGDMVSVQDVIVASNDANAILDHERNLMLVQLRNEVKKMFHVDIQSIVPEIAAAVLYMDQRKSLAS